MKRLLALALCALFALTAEARTLYVDASRPNNNGSGLSRAKAKRTIQAAINVAKKGDTILVYPGKYAPIKTNNRKIVVKAVEGRSKTRVVRPKTPTVVEGMSAAHVVLAEMGKAVKDVYIPTSGIYKGVKRSYTYYAGGTASAVAGFTLDGRHWEAATIGAHAGKLKSCTVTRVGGPCVSSRYDSSLAASGSKLVACTFTQNILYSDAMFACCKLNRCIVRNNSLWEAHLAYATSFANTLIVLNDSDPGWDVGSNNTFANCTLADNVLEFAVPSVVRSRFVNCILRNNYRPVDDCSCVRIDAYSVHSFAQTSKTNKNPKFGDGYRPAKGSYCIDRGKMTEARAKLLGAKDLAGRKRVRGGAIDLGCYEY